MLSRRADTAGDGFVMYLEYSPRVRFQRGSAPWWCLCDDEPPPWLFVFFCAVAVVASRDGNLRLRLISHMVAPKDHMSAAGEMDWPLCTSGAIYLHATGKWRLTFECVSEVAPAAPAIAFTQLA